MAQVNSMLQEVQADVQAVKVSQAKTATDVANLYDKLEQADARIMDLERENGRLDREARERARQYEDLRKALQDMENRERRNNLRLMGVKEHAENGKPRELVRGIISEALGINLSESELQRVHRTSGPLPNEDQPPRPFVMRFHSYLEKEKVLAAAIQRSRGRRGIMWNDCKISFFPDLTRDVVEKRKKFTDVRRKLHDLDIRFTLAYPAVLRFTWKGEKKRFDDPRKAMDLIADSRQKE
ncbi:hypothetical protein WMY93_015394 [Mugilogobius chulae]|uniref:L1 transposable element RRM domain-containing protein n=1 Tax=Mugilogobius chulae TaxID=88201 RepID=A0AAW0NR48_9GOBI